MGEPICRPVWMDISIAALRENITHLTNLANGRRIIASVKADGYGFGAGPSSRVFADAGVDMLATASMADAMAIRDEGVSCPILLFGGLRANDLPQAVRAGLIPTIGFETELDALRECPGPVPVFIKVETGLGRLGVPIEVASQFIRKAYLRPWISIAGVYTHFPLGDNDDTNWVAPRLAAFGALLDALRSAGISPLYTQALASAGTLLALDDPCNAISPGHSLYGLSPFRTGPGSESLTMSALQAVQARLISVRRFPEARTIGVGGVRSLPSNATLGVLPIGRADGWPGTVANEFCVRLEHHYAPVLGVSLEHTVIDLTGAPAAVDDIVTLVDTRDPRISLDALSKASARPALDLMIAMGPRVAKRYVDG
ncbi:MAG: alanine racemase [Pseudomonadota bacterium]